MSKTNKLMRGDYHWKDEHKKEVVFAPTETGRFFIGFDPYERHNWFLRLLSKIGFYRKQSYRAVIYDKITGIFKELKDGKN